MFGRLKTLISTLKSGLTSGKQPEPYNGPQHAGVYLFPGRPEFVPFGRTPAGFLVQCVPCIRVELSASDESLGRALLQVLDAFIPNRAVPESYSTERKEHLRGIGVRSERELQQQALYCSVYRDIDGFRFEPTHNGGTKGDSKGFAPVSDSITNAPSSTADELGAALCRAFALCTIIYDRPATP
jgi:hypothetical protein